MFWFRKFLLCAVLLLGIGPTAAGQGWVKTPEPESNDWIGAELELPSDWISIPAEYGWVHADPADRPSALVLARHAAERIPALAQELQVPVGPRIHIVLAHTTEHFRDLQPRPSPDWADGTAWPRRGWIFLRSPRLRDGTASPLVQVLDHEIVHVLLGRAFSPRPVPRWLQEGMAQLLAKEYTPELTRTLARGALGKNLLGIHEITRGFPRDPARAHLAYAQSADLVAFIRSEYGPEALPTLVREMTQGEHFGPALSIATGEMVDDVDAAWRARLGQSHFALTPLLDEGMWWGLGALLVPLAWLVVRRKNRVRLKRWEREEVLEDALYRVLERMKTPEDPPERPSPFIHPVPKDPSDWH